MYKEYYFVQTAVQTDDRADTIPTGRSLEFFEQMHRNISSDLRRNGLHVYDDKAAPVRIEINGIARNGSVDYTGLIILASEIFEAYSIASTILQRPDYLRQVCENAANSVHTKNHGITINVSPMGKEFAGNSGKAANSSDHKSTEEQTAQTQPQSILARAAMPILFLIILAGIILQNREQSSNHLELMKYMENIPVPEKQLADHKIVIMLEKAEWFETNQTETAAQDCTPSVSKSGSAQIIQLNPSCAE